MRVANAGWVRNEKKMAVDGPHKHFRLLKMLKSLRTVLHQLVKHPPRLHPASVQNKEDCNHILPRQCLWKQEHDHG